MSLIEILVLMYNVLQDIFHNTEQKDRVIQNQHIQFVFILPDLVLHNGLNTSVLAPNNASLCVGFLKLN